MRPFRGLLTQAQIDGMRIGPTFRQSMKVANTIRRRMRTVKAPLTVAQGLALKLLRYYMAQHPITLRCVRCDAWPSVGARTTLLDVQERGGQIWYRGRSGYYTGLCSAGCRAGLEAKLDRQQEELWEREAMLMAQQVRRAITARQRKAREGTNGSPTR